jgi:hypothetical protein
MVVVAAAVLSDGVEREPAVAPEVRQQRILDIHSAAIARAVLEGVVLCVSKAM